MSTYSNPLQPALQNLLQRVIRFFHPRSSCMTMHISADVQRITLNASCMTISGERTEQLDIFCRVTGFKSDFLSFIDVELIRFFHGALQLTHLSWTSEKHAQKASKFYITRVWCYILGPTHQCLHVKVGNVDTLTLPTKLTQSSDAHHVTRFLTNQSVWYTQRIMSVTMLHFNIMISPHSGSPLIPVSRTFAALSDGMSTQMTKS